jgi:isochorismate hydrolase
LARRRTRQERHDDDGGATALLVIDMLNPYEHPQADRLAERVAEALPGIRTLLRRAGEKEIPVVYVNDNYGDWNSSSEELARQAMDGAHPELVEPVLPAEGQSFVVKARHSIFYETPLEYLLDQMGVGRLVFAGQVTEQCITSCSGGRGGFSRPRPDERFATSPVGSFGSPAACGAPRPLRAPHRFPDASR